MASANRNPVASDLVARLPASPDAYPQKIDLLRGLVLVIGIDAGAYRASSFLDDRILTPSTQGTWVSLARAAEAAARITEPLPLHFIFHTGHVGSTLVSRLLDETGIVLPLREPLPLRSLAEARDVLDLPESLLSGPQFAETLGTMMQLWARGYDWTRAVIVKATSSAGRLAIPLLESRQAARAICLNLRAEPYLATLLAGANSTEDLRGHGPGRMRRLQAQCRNTPDALHRLSPGELAALGWLVETATQREAMRRFPERLLAIDFDSFLAAVPEHMERILGHLGLPRDDRYLAGVGTSSALQRYSKAPDQPYSPAQRAQVLRDSRRDNATEIRRGMAWLERLARTEPAFASLPSGADGP